MGAEQSSTRGAAAANDAPQKTDYYELLGLDFKATDDEYVNLSSPPPLSLAGSFSVYVSLGLII